MTHEELQDIYAYLSEIKNQLVDIQHQRSSCLGELFTSLAKAQSEMETAGLRANNPFFKSKYADLAEIVKASRPALTKNGLAVMQCVHQKDDGSQVLMTILGHSSGQSISSEIAITPSKTDVQSLGSYITYLRRYSYAAIVGVVVSDEDDDGNHAAQKTTIKSVEEHVTEDQLADLRYELNDHPEITQDILAKMNIKSLAEFPRSRYQDAIRKIREIKTKLQK